ncbi:MAG: hypothetical protein Q4B67_03700 [Eubacteriales bacterium]|nr:hypothetical protein [Eubacteriales bacterium]
MKNFKRFAALFVIGALAFSLAACGKGNTGNNTETEAATEASKDVTPEVGADTMGGKLWNAFLEAAAEDGATAESVANKLSTNEVILFMPMVMEAEEGLLAGFDNAEIKGFKSGYMFAPMISSIAFVNYVFELEDGADAAAFIKTLTDNANPAWNVCVQADQTVAGSKGNLVFFAMCPENLE